MRQEPQVCNARAWQYPRSVAPNLSRISWARIGQNVAQMVKYGRMPENALHFGESERSLANRPTQT
jgi:hypothetical protein